MRRPRALAVAALAIAVACAGCGLQGPGTGSGAVRIRVSENFGVRTVASVDAGSHDMRGSEAQLIAHHGSLTSTATGTGIAAVDGHGAGGDTRWFSFVNGVQTTKTAQKTTVHQGDHVWLDLHDAQRTTSISAVVGSFPEPFLHGIDGKRYPSTVSFAPADKPAAQLIMRQFGRYHIPLSSAGPGYGANDVLSVNLGTWSQLSGEVVAELLAYGPGASGVYAHFADGGHQLDLENASGTVVQRLGAGAGLICAISSSQDPVPTWLVIGTDQAGVLAAARAFTTESLAGRFALAVQGGHTYPVPVPGTS